MTFRSTILGMKHGELRVSNTQLTHKLFFPLKWYTHVYSVIGKIFHEFHRYLYLPMHNREIRGSCKRDNTQDCVPGMGGLLH